MLTPAEPIRRRFLFARRSRAMDCGAATPLRISPIPRQLRDISGRPEQPAETPNAINELTCQEGEQIRPENILVWALQCTFIEVG